jgi:hypothetical protein
VNEFDDRRCDTSEDALKRIVYSDLPVPRDVEHMGEFMKTPDGKVRLLSFPAAYSNPQPNDDGELIAQEVRLMGHQEENGTITYGVLIDVTLLVSAEEAALVAAAIRDVADNADSNNNEP